MYLLINLLWLILTGLNIRELILFIIIYKKLI
jgi:hypothetical protein